MLLSARSPSTVLPLQVLLQPLPQLGHPFLFGPSQRREAAALLARPFFGPRAHPSVLLVEFCTVISIITFHQCDFLIRQGRNPTANFLVGTAVLEIGHQILHGDSAGG